MTTTETEWWQEHGYLAGKPLDGGWLWLVVMPMIFTFRVAICTTDFVYEHYCYESLDDAMEAFNAWHPPEPNPVPGWTRHHQ